MLHRTVRRIHSPHPCTPSHRDANHLRKLRDPNHFFIFRRRAHATWMLQTAVQPPGCCRLPPGCSRQRDNYHLQPLMTICFHISSPQPEILPRFFLDHELIEQKQSSTTARGQVRKKMTFSTDVALAFCDGFACFVDVAMIAIIGRQTCSIQHSPPHTQPPPLYPKPQRCQPLAKIAGPKSFFPVVVPHGFSKVFRTRLRRPNGRTRRGWKGRGWKGRKYNASFLCGSSTSDCRDWPIGGVDLTCTPRGLLVGLLPLRAGHGVPPARARNAVAVPRDRAGDPV